MGLARTLMISAGFLLMPLTGNSQTIDLSDLGCEVGSVHLANKHGPFGIDRQSGTDQRFNDTNIVYYLVGAHSGNNQMEVMFIRKPRGSGTEEASREVSLYRQDQTVVELPCQGSGSNISATCAFRIESLQPPKLNYTCRANQ